MLHQHQHHLHSLLFLFLLLLPSITSASPPIILTFGSEDPSSSAERALHDALRSHGLPIGLLPRGVVDFRWTAEDDGGEGRGFEVRLERACDAKFENEVHYEERVAGEISYGRIGELKGVTAQELFLWFPVRAIRVDVPSSGLIYFDVGGVVFKQFSLSLFDTPPVCTAAAGGDDVADIIQSTRKLRHKFDQENAKWRREIL